MADNTTLNSGSGGDVIRLDDNSGVKTPVSKIELGVDGAFDGFVAAGNPMPVGGNTVKDGSGTVYALLVDSSGNQQVVDVPVTSGGLSMHRTISAASTNATSVKGAAGQLYALQAFNLNASPAYLKLYNKASAPTVGTDTPVKTIMIPGNAAGTGVVTQWDKGLAFGTGLAFALTTGIGDSDTTAVAANEVLVHLDYK